jgi:hypothetical protein
MDPNVMPTRHAAAVEAEVDGQRVLMSPVDYSYFGLVGTGAIVWDRLDGSVSLGELADALAAEFNTDVDQVRREVSEFVDALTAAGLLADS